MGCRSNQKNACHPKRGRQRSSEYSGNEPDSLARRSFRTSVVHPGNSRRGRCRVALVRCACEWWNRQRGHIVGE